MTLVSALKVSAFSLLSLATIASAGQYASVLSTVEFVPPLDHTGDYIVPAPAELAAVSAFKITYGIGQDKDGGQVLAYQLPDLIAGPRKPIIALKQTGPTVNGFTPFAYEHSTANCRMQKDDITCFVLYPGMDTTGSEDAVKQQFGNAPDFDLRMQLARVFSSDPKGVLRVKKF